MISDFQLLSKFSYHKAVASAAILSYHDVFLAAFNQRTTEQPNDVTKFKMAVRAKISFSFFLSFRSLLLSVKTVLVLNL